MHKSLVAVIFTLFSIAVCNSQYSKKQFTVKLINTPITLDGVLDEKSWEIADSAADFFQYFPTDSLPAIQPTVIKMLYDNTYLYIAITVHAKGNAYVIPSLERDFRAGGNDNISLLFDTFNDGTIAFLFGINPYGVQREALISGGGSELRGFNTTWDVKWKSETRMYDGYYIAEISIPLTSFKFKEGETKWRFNSYRFDTQTNEQSTWSQIPQNQFIFNLAFMGDMIFEKPLGKSRTPLALIPYVNTAFQKDHETEQSITDFSFGGDAKIAIGNGMNLDITINPDFSNVEVDDVITNLTRFEIGLPERRQFFIDNSDLFADFGDSEEANPFFSRRIGIAEDLEGNTIQNDIIGGVRLSGKLNRDWRLGFLNLQTAEDVTNAIPSDNNTVLALQRKVFARSNIGFLFVNRQTFQDYDFLENTSRYNRVIGIDYNLASADNTWVGKGYFHKSFTPETSGDDISAGARMRFNSRYYQAGISSRLVGENFNSDLGFIRRKDILTLEPSFSRIFWPANKNINSHQFNINSTLIWRPGLDFKNTDYTHRLSWEAEFRNQANATAGITHRFIFLTETFDPTGKDAPNPLPENKGFQYTGIDMEFASDRRKVFSYRLRPSGGEFFNGHIFSMEAEANLRLQPRFFTSLRINYDRIQLPEPFPSASIIIINPRFDITFTRSVFWSTIIQYSNQTDNLGINTRLQWRFAPLSDLFVVYNDNYTTNTFGPRNRSLNIKITYWLNI
ncbi:DUF5916 domain-containing protein [Ascidiimonas aurantiaca]|uniref:DUF5916 domain-containing protein n=1 Tax=Ascidiimonas aurantiaca TaxID=1685432 RepID=UPI0030ECC2C6